MSTYKINYQYDDSESEFPETRYWRLAKAQKNAIAQEAGAQEAGAQEAGAQGAGAKESMRGDYGGDAYWQKRRADTNTFIPQKIREKRTGKKQIIYDRDVTTGAEVRGFHSENLPFPYHSARMQSRSDHMADEQPPHKYNTYHPIKYTQDLKWVDPKYATRHAPSIFNDRGVEPPLSPNTREAFHGDASCDGITSGQNTLTGLMPFAFMSNGYIPVIMFILILILVILTAIQVGLLISNTRKIETKAVG